MFESRFYWYYLCLVIDMEQSNIRIIQSDITNIKDHISILRTSTKTVRTKLEASLIKLLVLIREKC